MDHSLRQARFTSSKIHNLIKKGRGEFGFGAPALTYIEEKRIEQRLQSPLDAGGYSQSMAWGKWMEIVVFDHLGMEYKMVSQQTVTHPDPELGKYWSGSADLIVPEKRIAEIKCYQKKKFAQYTDALLTKSVDVLRDHFPEEYWQIVSNCILNNVPNGEAITFMPYEEEMTFIREMVGNYDSPDQWQYRFIVEKPNHELPVLKKSAYYKNVNKFEFEIPQEDIELLTERVEKGIILLTRE